MELYDKTSSGKELIRYFRKIIVWMVSTVLKITIGRNPLYNPQ